MELVTVLLDDSVVIEVEHQGPKGDRWSSPYTYIQSESTGGYKYFGFASIGGWKILRRDTTSGVWDMAIGSGSYTDAWSAKADKVYT